MGNLIQTREYKKDELEIGLGVRNSIFPPITKEAWKLGEPQTASIAFSGDEAIGFIPLSLRNFKIAPDITITAAFENAVGVNQEYRGQGVGTLMLEEAGRFLKGRADALFVYRSDERSKGYRFYKHTNHTDLMYMRNFTCDLLGGTINENVDVSTGIHELVTLSADFLRIFEETYSSYGGFLTRIPHYWTRNIERRSCGALPVSFLLFKLKESNATTAYIIAGEIFKPQHEENSKTLEIFEMAAKGCDEEKIKILLQSVSAFAGREGFSKVNIMASDQSPFVSSFFELNFKPGGRSMQLMASDFEIESLVKKLLDRKIDLPGIEILVRTPRRDMVFQKPLGEINRIVTLEMKDDTFVQWVMGRVDFRSRVHEGSITVINGNNSILDVLANAIPLNNWVYHALDYI